jgi:predicted DNA-binding transcriptional regulator AlpA
MEVICLVAETLQLAPQLGELPVSPVEGVEALLTADQLSAWTGWSRTTIFNYRTRAANPLPSIGGTTTRRYLPSEVIDWLREEGERANTPQ